MKKIITCLLTLSMMFMFSATAFASDFSGNAESELSNISDKIVTAVNDVYSDKNISITAEDINYDSAFKIYVDTNVFKLSTNVAGEIENALENGNYIYLLPIDTVNGTVVVNFQKGLPLSENAKAILSEEEQQEVLQYRIVANKCKTQEIHSSAYRKYQIRWKSRLLQKTGYIEEKI